MDKLLEIKLHPADVRLICSALMAYSNQLESVRDMASMYSDQIGMDFDTLSSLEAFYDNRRTGCHCLVKKLDKVLK